MISAHLLKISRLEGLTDGIFAIAMTIMVLNLHVPVHSISEHILPAIKHDIFANLLIYIGSFVILGTHWVAMNFQLGLLNHLNRPYLWTNIFYLMVICVVPFSANLLGVYPRSIYSITFYSVNLLCSSIGQLITLECAHHYKLYKKMYTRHIHNAALRRIFVAPPFYIGAIILTHWSNIIAFALLVAPTLIYIIPGQIDRFEGG